MFLYELAIELDRKSGELVDAAAALGMGALMASSELDAAQVHQLRQRLGGPAGAPAPPTGPVTFAPPAADGPPPFAPPVAFEPVGAPAGGPTPPAPPVAFAPPVAGGPGPFAPPTAAPMPSAAPPPPPIAPDPSGPARPGARPGPGGFSRAQLVLLGMVGVLVVGLFGFMFATGGPDESRERAIAEDETSPEPRTAEAPTTLATTTMPAETTTTFAQDLTVPVDEATFCDGGRSLVAFHLRISAAIVDEDLAELQGIARDDRGSWDTALDQVSVGGPPALVDEVERYQAGVGVWLDALVAGADLESARQQAGGIEFIRALNAGDEFIRQVGFYCE